MECGSCAEMIPDDSIFCPECGARQEMSRAGSFAPQGGVGLSGQEVSGGRNFGVVSGEAVRQQRDANMGGAGNVPPELLQQIASGISNQQNFPPGTFPPQGMNQQFPPQGMNQMPPQGMNQQFPGQQPSNIGGSKGDLPQQARGPSLASGAMPTSNVSNVLPTNTGGTAIAQNPSNSPTDEMVNRLAEAERAMKNERRSQWLSMNQSPASNVLASLGAELPSHLQGVSPAAEVMAETLGQKSADAPNDALLKRMCEVATRRVARKRGVAIDTPTCALSGDDLSVNVTFVDDGRVLDTPEDLAQAFEHAIQTELALKGLDISVSLNLLRSKDGEVETLVGSADSADDDEEMFACEVCDGLVKESDNECPHCGAVFEEEEDEEEAVRPSGGPPGPGSRSGPPGPSRAGGPPGPSKAGGPPGPSRAGGPPGPSKAGGPPGPKGPSRAGGPPGPSKAGGPPGPSKSGGPPGPKGPSRAGGPPGPSKAGGPPGPSKSGGPPKKTGGPPGPKGPSRAGGPPGGAPKGPPKGGPGGAPKGPPKGGPGGGPPKKGGGPPGPKRGPPR